MKATLGLQGATCIDFTESLAGFHHAPGFDQKIVQLLRAKCESKILVLVDMGFGFSQNVPHLVSDHLNLTGDNPLVGPNDPIGERFPVLKDLYLLDVLPSLPRGVLAGLKPGVLPTREEEATIRRLGGEFFSYNFVQTAIIAGHAGWKIAGIVTPEGADLVSALKGLLD